MAGYTPRPFLSRKDFSEGDYVEFGSDGGEKTPGIITKTNVKTAKVKILFSRGAKSPAGAVWGVGYSLMRKLTPDEVKELQKELEARELPAADLKSLRSLVRKYGKLRIQEELNSFA